MDIYYNFLDTTVDDLYIIEALGEVLDKAWEEADDRAKEFIARRRECLTVDAWEGFLAYTKNFNYCTYGNYFFFSYTRYGICSRRF